VHAEITTSHVKVLVTGKRYSELKEVYLVINGDDLEDRWIKLDPADPRLSICQLADLYAASA
jgi:hypothetical protein